MDENDTANLSRAAINAALAFNWDEAVVINKQIIKENPEDIDCLNRLARALFELGKASQAKKIYQSVLELDPYNIIAQKNLKKVTGFKKDSSIHTNGTSSVLSPTLFLEEAGITKVVNLVKLTEPQKLSYISPGMSVALNPKNRSISVTDFEDNYLGVLPDDISHMLLRLIKGGNKYQAVVKSVRQNSLSILIRETFRSKKFRNQPSFISDSKVITYSSEHINLPSDDADEVIEEGGDSEDLVI